MFLGKSRCLLKSRDILEKSRRFQKGRGAFLKSWGVLGSQGVPRKGLGVSLESRNVCHNSRGVS